MVVKTVFGGEKGEEAPAIDEDALHLPRRRAAAASPTWRYLLLETSRKVVWTVPASARERVYGPSAALLLGPAGSCESERSRRVTSRRRSLGESRRACSRSFSTALMAVLAQLGFYPREGRFPTFSGRLATASARHSRVFGGPPSNGRRTVKVPQSKSTSAY